MSLTNDTKLSSLSFVDKDFPAIYRDVLDLSKKISENWDPSTSNESDPGVVLLKLASFIADHLNYNIDKTILENFLPSATQETSVRNLVEMNGYTPKYYTSASGDVTFVFNDNSLEQNYIIPKYTIVLTNEKANVTFTQIEPLMVNIGKKPSSCKFIEGSVAELKVDGSNKILLENIDDNNRLYFPSKNVAQNGIVIRTLSETTASEDWTQVDYLNTMPVGSKVYKIDFDSAKQLPYIEFPSDIADLIGAGLNVIYIATKGAKGNISAGTLTKISSPEKYAVIDTAGNEIELDLTKFRVSNTFAFLNGKDPETIDEMYRSFKKIVGTFETLVTRKDYVDKIRSLKRDEQDVVSNCIVTDSTNDFNRSTAVLTIDDFGEHVKHLVKGFTMKFNAEKPETPVNGDVWVEDGGFKLMANDEETDLTSMSLAEFANKCESMTPYDICIYAFNAYKYISTNIAVNNIATYTPVSASDLNYIEQQINSLKSLNHRIMAPANGDVLMIRNFAPIRATIMPYSKVDKDEANELIEIAAKALADNFSANSLDFGEELDYDEVLSVLLNCDDRIADIRLEDITYEPEVLKLENDTINSSKLFDENDTSTLKAIIAKNVLAGRSIMLNVDDEFNAHFGTKNRSTYKNIQSIRSDLAVSTSNNAVNLGENENINIIWPSYSADIIYPSYVKYKYVGATIAPNTEHRLSAGESLSITYTQDGITKTTEFGTGEVISPSFELEQTETGIIAAGNTISHMDEMKTTLTSSYLNCSWNRNNEENCLFLNDEIEYILGTDEFFAYADEEFTTFIMFGPGTKLIRHDTDNDRWKLGANIESSAIDKLESAWKVMNFAVDNFDICEMNIITLSNGYQLKLDSNVSLNSSSWTDYSGSISFKTATETDFTIKPSRSDYQIKTSLDIKCGPDVPQVLATGSNNYHRIYITYVNDSDQTDTVVLSACTIISSIDINTTGDTSLNTKGRGLVISKYLLSPTTIGDTEVQAINNEYEGTITSTNRMVLHLSYDTSKHACIIPIYIKNGSIAVNVNSASQTRVNTIKEYIFGTAGDTVVGQGDNSILNIYVPKLTGAASTSNLTVYVTTDATATITAKDPIIYNGLHESIPDYVTEDDITAVMKNLIEDSSTPEVRPLLKVSTNGDDMIQEEAFDDAMILFDANNIANPITIPAIDFENSNINIHKSMRLYSR